VREADVFLCDAKAALESGGRVDRRRAYELGSTAIERMMRLRGVGREWDLVAYRGGSAFEFGSRAVAVVSGQRGDVDVF